MIQIKKYGAIDIGSGALPLFVVPGWLPVARIVNWRGRLGLEVWGHFPGAGVGFGGKLDLLDWGLSTHEDFDVKTLEYFYASSVPQLGASAWKSSWINQFSKSGPSSQSLEFRIFKNVEAILGGASDANYQITNVLSKMKSDKK